MNKRNHPYYNTDAAIAHHQPTPAPTPVPFSNNPFYQPRIADPINSRWMENEKRTIFLAEMYKRDTYNRGMGYAIDDVGYIYSPETGDEAMCGVISAQVIASQTDKDCKTCMVAPTNIVNTEDCGLRYVQVSETGHVLDLGPVEHTCVIGNINRPEGIYVPTCNTKAMADGITLLNELYRISTEDDRDLPIVHDVEDFEKGNIPIEIKNCAERIGLEHAAMNKLAALEAENDHHECTCGGNCKCGDECKCGGNCKCKKK